MADFPFFFFYLKIRIALDPICFFVLKIAMLIYLRYGIKESKCIKNVRLLVLLVTNLQSSYSYPQFKRFAFACLMKGFQHILGSEKI